MLEERHGYIFLKYSFFDTLSNICNGLAVKIILGGSQDPLKVLFLGKKWLFFTFGSKKTNDDQISEGNIK